MFGRHKDGQTEFLRPGVASAAPTGESCGRSGDSAARIEVARSARRRRREWTSEKAACASEHSRSDNQIPCDGERKLDGLPCARDAAGP